MGFHVTNSAALVQSRHREPAEQVNFRSVNTTHACLNVMPFRLPASYLSYSAYNVSFLDSQNDTLTHVNIVSTSGSK
jgi:hypothetical protein